GSSLNVSFEWGSTASYGQRTAPQAIGSGESEVNFTDVLSSLAPGEYHYRAVGTFGALTIVGLDQTFVLKGPALNAISLNGTDYFRTTLWSPQLFTDKGFTFEFWFNASSPGVLVGEADTADVAQWDYSFAEILPGGVIKAGVP